MTREDAIRSIEGLFPPDAPYPDTATIGQRLLDQAKREAQGWRDLPDAVLFRFADLCQEEELRQVNER